MLRLILSWFLAFAATTNPQVVTYEGSSFPEDDGWVRSDRPFLPMRWLENGYFVQYTQIYNPGPPYVPEDDFYARNPTTLAGVQRFFLEWRMQTDGTSDGIPDVAPAVVVAGGFAGLLYHFTLSADQVRFVRDTQLPVVFVDIQPHAAHTYRLELLATQAYAWYVDAQLVDSNVPEGPYPTSDSEIKFGARAPGEQATTSWDYIRFGVIPDDASGDYDSDAAITLRDFYFVQECLSNARPGINGGPSNDAGPGCRFTDFDSDSDVDLLDLASFQLNFTGAP